MKEVKCPQGECQSWQLPRRTDETRNSEGEKGKPQGAEDRGRSGGERGMRARSGWKPTEVEDVSVVVGVSQGCEVKRDGPDWREVEVREKVGQERGRKHQGGYSDG